MAYEITVNMLTTFFVLIMILPFALNLFIHLHNRNKRIVRDRDNRIWINGKEVTNLPMKEFHHG